MYRQIKLLLLIVFVSNTFLTAQFSLPDYKERNFFNLSDTLRIEPGFLQATEGSVDPDEYRIGPGDKIFISLRGVEEKTLNLMVNQEGYLYIPSVGGVPLHNTSLTESKVRIKTAIDRYYKNIDVFISLVDFRKIKVSLLGNVERPSSHVLPGNARLLDLISTAGGLPSNANYRSIKISRRDGLNDQVDLISFFRTGDRIYNPLMREGDVVTIDKVDRTVTVSGMVKYPGVYEFIEGETIYQLLNLTGGFYQNAKTDSIEIIRFSDDGKSQFSQYFSLDEIRDRNLYLNNKDMILVREIPEYLVHRFVQIEGWVKYPGFYKIVKDRTLLSEIIAEAGGIRQGASLNEAVLMRSTGIDNIDPEFERLKILPRQEMTDDEYNYLKAKSRQRVGRVVVDFESLISQNNLLEDLVLKRGDYISIPEEKNYIVLLGQVVNPGNIIYQPGLKVNDYIRLAGGFGWRALTRDVRVVKANTGEWIDADKVKVLEPGDTIWVPEDPPGPKFWDIFTQSLTILGQVAAIIAATMAVIISSR
jgi:polysaccharide biosynthesis/export protein